MLDVGKFVVGNLFVSDFTGAFRKLKTFIFERYNILNMCKTILFYTNVIEAISIIIAVQFNLLLN